MLAQKEFVKVFETLGTRFPWMSDPVKVNIHMKRKDVLLFIQMAEIGLASADLKGLIIGDIEKDVRAVLKDMMEKAQLNEFVEGLQDLLLGGKEKA
jgi:hypothetical protein